MRTEIRVAGSKSESRLKPRRRCIKWTSVAFMLLSCSLILSHSSLLCAAPLQEAGSVKEIRGYKVERARVEIKRPRGAEKGADKSAGQGAEKSEQAAEPDANAKSGGADALIE
ncbi:MAG TPA: hypothetical protein VGB17_07985, partial [Pyrinomonadaceae bacterium]